MTEATHLRIWYISKYVSLPGLGAAGIRGFSLMQELSRVGHSTTIITSDSNHLIEPPIFAGPHFIQDIAGVSVCWVRTFKYFSSRSLRRVLSWLHFEWRCLFLPFNSLGKPDVLIVSSLSLFSIINGLLLRSIYNCPLIFEVRDIWPLTLTEEGGFKSFNPLVLLLGLLEYLAYRFSDAIVGTMPNLGDHVENVLGFHKPTYCIPMGVDSSSYAVASELDVDFVNTFFPKDKLIVAHVGSIGITNALDAFFECAHLMADVPFVHFLVIGDGDLREKYQLKYQGLQNLSFVPKIPKSMVQHALSLCDILYFSVFNSRVWDFGQSLNKVVDYMLAGKPIVASYSGFPSMINEARCGSFVHAGDALALRDELLTYAELDCLQRQEIGLRGREWLLQNRSYRKLATDYLNIIYKYYFKRLP